MIGSSNQRNRRGHTLMELVAAMVCSVVLLAGLGSVMLIARQVAYAPSAAQRRTEAAQLVRRLADELRFATIIVEHIDEVSEQSLEFVVLDRDNPADGAAERIRYDWPLNPDPNAAADPSVTAGLYKTVNGRTWVIAKNVVDYGVVLEPPLIPGQRFSRALVRLQTGAAAHSRVEAAIPLIARPQMVAAYWRADFDQDPTMIDVDGGGETDGDSALEPDWVASGGATFGNPQMQNGAWLANGALATSPDNDFTDITVVEARCKNMAASGAVEVLRINADRQGGTYAPLIVRMQLQPDGSQTLTLLGKPTSASPGVALTADAGSILATSVVENLPDDYVRFQLTIVPAQNKVILHVNDVILGTFAYYIHPPTSTEKCVTIGGGAKFDYIDVRVLAD